MEIRHLEYFVAVVQSGSILQAAKKLNLSQPPLSVAMKQLEKELHAPLFLRGSRSIQLTDAGRLFYQRAQTILAMTEGTCREIQSYAQGIQGTLRLGAVSSSGASLLNHRLLLFHKIYPNIHYEIMEGNTFQQLEFLERGLIDLALVRTPFQKDGIERLPLDQDCLAAVCHQDHSFFAKNKITLSQLDGKPLIYYRRFASLIQQECEKAGFIPRTLCLNDDARTSMQWAQAGLGIAIVPISAISSMDSRSLKIYPIENEQLITQTCLIWMKNRPLPQVAYRFLETVQKEKTANDTYCKYSADPVKFQDEKILGNTPN